MTCRITITDANAAQLVMQAPATQGMTAEFGVVDGGGQIYRYLNGPASKRQRWQKRRVDISGEGSLPPSVLWLDFSRALTVQVETARAGDARTISGFSMGPTETWNYTDGITSWTISVEEA